MHITVGRRYCWGASFHAFKNGGTTKIASPPIGNHVEPIDLDYLFANPHSLSSRCLGTNDLFKMSALSSVKEISTLRDAQFGK